MITSRSMTSALHVGLDGRPLNRAHLRGMGKYVVDLVRAADQGHCVRWRSFADRPDLPLHAPPLRDLTSEVFETRGYRFRAWEQWGLPRRVSKAGVDVLHCTATTLPWWQPVPTVVTIHDTIPWQPHEPGHEPRWYLHQLIPRAYARCAAVITISENSKRDILALWPALEPKLHVIPHGIDPRYHASNFAGRVDEKRALGIQPPYFVYLGGALPRKRLDWALRVFEGLRDQETQLVVCGVGHEEREGVMAAIGPDLRRRILIAPFIAEELMPVVLQHSVAVLYPTLYEGFGLPAVEAQAVGTPVMFSRVGSLSELDGPGAVLLPTDDLRAWVDACENALVARRGNPQPNDAARKWAQRFSWEESARRHMEVYARAAALRRCPDRP